MRVGRNVLQTVDLAVGYGKGRQCCAVLDGLRLALRAGELVGILGANGSGKSTLLRTLAGLQPALSGHIELLGDDLAGLDLSQRARRIGIVLPDRSPTGLLSVFELVALGRFPYTGWTGRLGRDDIARIEWALEQVGMTEFADREAGRLSDGERQKVMIARALAQEPTVLLLDEPTAFLDLPGRVEVLALLRRLARTGAEEQRAVLLSTHDLDLALRTADRLWLVRDGKVRMGAPEDLALGGDLERAFAGRHVEFDEDLGTFRPRAPSGLEIEFKPSGRVGHWTRRALERAGYRVTSESALRLIVEERDEANAWILETADAGRFEAESLEKLLGALQDLQARVSANEISGTP